MYHILFLVILSLPSLAQESFEKEMATVRTEFEAAVTSRKSELEKDNPNFEKEPPAEFVEFYSSQIDKMISKVEDICTKNSECKSKNLELLKDKSLIAKEHMRKKQEWAKTDNYEEQEREFLNKSRVGLCLKHQDECKNLTRDQKVLLEKLKGEDSSVAPNLKINKKVAEDDKVKEQVKDKPEVQKEPKPDEALLKCKEERLTQLKSLVKTDLKSKEEELSKNHSAKWEALQKKDCQSLLEEDRKAFAPKEVVVTPHAKEEDENEDEKSPRNYNADTCNWVTDMPRRVVYGPSCGKTLSRICTGYVVCEQKTGGAKFVRMSTCGPEHCGGSQKDAINCTKQQGYFSRKAPNESKEFVSPKVKKILSGAVKQ